MSPSNKEVASLIVDYLAQLVEDKKVSEDAADSLNVAIDCIAESFEVQKGNSKTLFGGKNLLELLKTGSSPVSGASTSASREESVQVNIPPEDAKTKAKAEALKLEGNKAMASKDFELAVKKYTEAIAVLPTNAVYFANRAAAYSSLKNYEEAIKDAESAIETDPSYSKGYSRLGYAKFALGRAEDALEAYKKVLDIEGDNASDVMKRDYETAKKKVEQALELEKKPEVKSRSEGGSGAGGFDFASMLGGGLGGLLNNPQLMQAAQQMMQNPQAMQQMENIMQNPGVRQMAENFAQGGGVPNMSDLMNNPALREMAGNLFTGSEAGANDVSSNGGSEASGDAKK